MKRGSSLLLLALVPALFASAASLPGCGLQPEGGRCSTKNTVDGVSQDCQDGLICVPASEIGPDQGTDVCCPELVAQRSDPSCRPTVSSSSSSSSSSSGSSSSSSTSSSGASSSSSSSASSSSGGGGGGGGNMDGGADGG